MMFLRYTFLIAIGGAIGAVARYWTSESIHIFERGFPLGIMVVNVIGSFLMGFLAFLLLQKFPHSIEIRSFFLIGLPF